MSCNEVSAWMSTKVARECRLSRQRAQQEAKSKKNSALQGPVGTASCCTFFGPRQSSLVTMVNIHTLKSLQDNAGWSSIWFLPFLSLTLHELAPLFYKQSNDLTPLAVWKLLTNRKWVVAGYFLGAICPVLLTWCDIPRKGLQHNGTPTVHQFYRNKYLFPHSKEAGWSATIECEVLLHCLSHKTSVHYKQIVYFHHFLCWFAL